VLPRLALLALLLAIAVSGLLEGPQSAAAASPEARMTAGINFIRASHGLRPLRYSPGLTSSANRRARKMVRRNVFGHFPSSARRFTPIGEVIGLRFGRRPGTGKILRQWMNSPGHRHVLMHPSMRYIGTAAVRGRMGRRMATTWVVRAGGRRR
jgi:uncharacterized protein YkwD